MSKCRAEQIRHVSMRQLGSRFLIVDPFTNLLPEVTASGMPLVVKSVSQGDELNQLVIIEWLIHYPLITASSKQRGDMERCCHTANPHCKVI